MTNQLSVTAPEGLPFIEFEREFDAPVAAVFRAHQDPDLVKQWLGPHGYEMDIERYDYVSQGGYRYVHRNPEGEEFTFNGVFHVVRENEFAVQTFEFEGFPDVVSIESMTFVDLGDGRTRLRGHAVYPSVESRDAMVSSGMEGGMTEGYERLDQLRRDGPGLMDWTLEVVVLPVGDLDAAIAFYRDKVGFHLDHRTTNEHMDVAQLTPRGSGCSVVIGNLPSQNEMAPGSMRGLQLVVADAYAARQELLDRGVDASEVTVFDERDGGTFFGFVDPDGNTWAVQQLKVRGAQPLIPYDSRGRFGAATDPEGA